MAASLHKAPPKEPECKSGSKGDAQRPRYGLGEGPKFSELLSSQTNYSARAWLQGLNEYTYLWCPRACTHVCAPPHTGGTFFKEKTAFPQNIVNVYHGPRNSVIKIKTTSRKLPSGNPGGYRNQKGPQSRRGLFTIVPRLEKVPLEYLLPVPSCLEGF